MNLQLTSSTKKSNSVFFLILILIKSLCADIITTQSSMEFKLNSNQTEVTLNNHGLGISNSSPSSNLHFSGTMAMSSEIVRDDATIGEHSLIVAGNATKDITLTLPSASTMEGRVIKIKKIVASNNILIDSSSDFDGFPSIILNTVNNISLPFVELVSVDNNWYILNKRDLSYVIDFDLAVDVTLKEWYDTSDTSSITINASNEATALEDLSGGGNHLLGAGGTYMGNGITSINERNALSSSGANYLRLDGDFIIPNSGNLAFFMVAVVDTDGVDNSSDAIFSSDDVTDFQIDNFNPTTVDLQGQGSVVGDNSHRDGLAHIFNVNFDFANSIYNLYVDASQEGSDNSYTTKLSSSATNGKELNVFVNRSENNPVKGALGEFIITEDVTENTRKKIEAYLAQKWGISLPSGHIYENYYVR